MIGLLEMSLKVKTMLNRLAFKRRDLWYGIKVALCLRNHKFKALSNYNLKFGDENNIN